MSKLANYIKKILLTKQQITKMIKYLKNKSLNIVKMTLIPLNKNKFLKN